MFRARLLFLASVVLVFLTMDSVPGDRTQRIRIMGTGKASQTPILANWLTVEPSTDPSIIPMRTFGEFTVTVIKRYMRIYFPRNFEALLEFEHFFMACVDIQFLTQQQQRWLYDAFTEHQKGGGIPGAS